jgi:RNA polymerase sigma factor (sigma-70 family)
VQSDHLERLSEQYCCRLLAFIRRRVSDEADAEDILQEVFIRVHRNLCCSNEWNKPESWIYQVTRNLIIDFYQRCCWCNPGGNQKDDKKPVVAKQWVSVE